MQLDELDYDLPQELIAQQPVGQRDEARMLVLDRTGSLPMELLRVRDLGTFLRSGDCLVVNDTRVLPARFQARRATGGRVEGLYIESPSPGRWTVLLKPSARLRVGESLQLVGDSARLRLVSARERGRWDVDIDPPQPAPEVLERIGWTPLPPYIKRSQDAGDSRSIDAFDRERYQTVYARAAGAVAAPTAGLHLTERLLSELAALGVTIVPVTLHVGLGTFEPVTVARLEDHRIHAEHYELSESAAGAIAASKTRGGRTVAVGTTSARVLETCAAPNGRLSAGRGATSIFIYPPYRFCAVDALLTNFHLPRSTLLAMVFAFAGRERILGAYRHAIERRLRFYSYGDAMLIL